MRHFFAVAFYAIYIMWTTPDAKTGKTRSILGNVVKGISVVSLCLSISLPWLFLVVVPSCVPQADVLVASHRLYRLPSSSLDGSALLGTRRDRQIVAASLLHRSGCGSSVRSPIDWALARLHYTSRGRKGGIGPFGKGRIVASRQGLALRDTVKRDGRLDLYSG